MVSQLGYTTIGTAGQRGLATTYVGFIQITVPAGGIDVVDIKIYGSAGYNAGLLQAGFYNSSLALIAGTTSSQASYPNYATVQWNTLTDSCTLAAGTYYLGWISSQGFNVNYDANAGITLWANNNASWATQTTPLVKVFTWTNTQPSVYIDYNPVSTGIQRFCLLNEMGY